MRELHLIFLLVASVSLSPWQTAASTLLVRNNNDAGAGSLRQAINDNNALGGSNTITFSNIVTGTINVIGGELFIHQPVAVVGPGAEVLTLSGNFSNRVFNVSNSVMVSISGLTIAQGTAPFGSPGGGIYNLGNLTVTSCLLSNNGTMGNYGAAIANMGTLLVSDSTLCSNRTTASGGCLYNNGGTVTIQNSSLYGNQGYQGGCLNNQGGATLFVLNCTLYANHGGDGGGGIFNVGSLTVRNSTIVSNNAVGAAGNGGGGGIWKIGSSSATIRNTIIAGNTSTNGPDCFGTNFTSAGYNLIGKVNPSTGWIGVGDQTGTSGSPLDPLLGPFQNNGGPTLTMAPLPGSLAIDQGNSSGPGFVTDQRGRPRPADFSSIPNATAGDGSDIGAVEIWPANPVLKVHRTGANVVLAWPQEAVDFHLQSITNLSSNSWSTVPGAPTMANGELFLTNAASGASKFYRLTFP